MQQCAVIKFINRSYNLQIVYKYIDILWTDIYNYINIGTLESLFRSAEGVRHLCANLSGKRTEKKVIFLLFSEEIYI